MKDKELFDILEDAENDSMDRLKKKCPEISDKQLDKILVMSERKFNMKNNGTYIKRTDNSVVEGVERSRRPAWLAPLSTAASVILIAGIVIGSTALIKKNSRKVDSDNIIVPGAVTSTSTVTETETLTETTTLTETATLTTASAIITTQPVTGNSADPISISEIAGKWLIESSKYNEMIMIKADGTYTINRENGDVVAGTVVIGTEEIGGTVHKTVTFYEAAPNGEFSFGGYYDRNDPDVITIGNGGESKLVRVKDDKDSANASDSELKKFVGKWIYQMAEGNNTVQEKPVKAGTVVINEDGTYLTYDLYGGITGGIVKLGTEDGFVDGSTVPTINFYIDGSDEIAFGGWYSENDLDTINIGNGGTARLIRDNGETADDNAPDIDVNAIVGEWTYQVADGNTTVDKAAKDNGTVVINADATYKYVDADGNSSEGTLRIGTEDIGGTKATTVSFYKDTYFSFGGYYDKASPDTIFLGNGGMSRLVRK